MKLTDDEKAALLHLAVEAWKERKLLRRKWSEITLTPAAFRHQVEHGDITDPAEEWMLIEPLEYLKLYEAAIEEAEAKYQTAKQLFRHQGLIGIDGVIPPLAVT